MVESKIRDFLIASDHTEILREKLVGHKAAVNSIDYFHPQIAENESGYFQQSFKDHGLILSASDDGTALVWDLRINKRVMLI